MWYFCTSWNWLSLRSTRYVKFNYYSRKRNINKQSLFIAAEKKKQFIESYTLRYRIAAGYFQFRPLPWINSLANLFLGQVISSKELNLHWNFQHQYRYKNLSDTLGKDGIVYDLFYWQIFCFIKGIAAENAIFCPTFHLKKRTRRKLL